jgi:hypothetical protein
MVVPMRELLASAEYELEIASVKAGSSAPITATGTATASPTAGAGSPVVSLPVVSALTSPLTVTQPAALTSPLPAPAVQAPVTSTTATVRISAIGDSVMRGAAPQLVAAMPGISIDATIGRLPWDVAGVVQAHINAHDLQPIVVIHTGGNGMFTPQMLDQIMALLADRKRVVFITIKVPREWESYDNRMLAANVSKYPNAVLVDWRALSMSHPDWFWGDAIHVREEGAKAFARLIADAVFKP